MGHYMYELFRKNTLTVKRGEFTPTAYDNTYKYVQQQFAKLKKYYTEFPPLAKENSVIGKLLNDMKVTARLDWESIYDRTTDDAGRLCQLNGIMSPISNGMIHNKGDILPKGKDELYVYVRFPMEFEDLESTWMDLQPVRWLQHDSSDINMPLLGSRRAIYMNLSGNMDYGVIAIDIGMLAVKYHCWRHFHLSKLKMGSSPNKGSFIGGWVLPDMVPSFHDIAMFNRLVTITNGKTPDTNGNTHSFTVYHLDPLINKVIEQSIYFVTKKRLLQWDEVYGYMPSFFNGDMFTALCIPSVPDTRQLSWALDVARLSMISWSLKNIRTKNLYTDRRFLNDIKIDLRGIMSSNILKAKLKYDYYRIERLIEKNIKYYL